VNTGPLKVTTPWALTVTVKFTVCVTTSDPLVVNVAGYVPAGKPAGT